MTVVVVGVVLAIAESVGVSRMVVGMEVVIMPGRWRVSRDQGTRGAEGWMGRLGRMGMGEQMRERVRMSV